MGKNVSAAITAGSFLSHMVFSVANWAAKHTQLLKLAMMAYDTYKYV